MKNSENIEKQKQKYRTCLIKEETCTTQNHEYVWKKY